MAFLKDNFGWKESTGAWFFGLIIFLLGIPCVLSQDAFNEFDYWAGTISLVVFALIEIILFAWVFGLADNYSEWRKSDDVLPFKAMKRLPAWKEITRGADINVPIIFKFIIKYVSPIFLLIVFIGAIPGIIDNATKETSFYGWLARFLLLTLFILISFLVYIAAKRNKNSKLY
jgi:SNF family Na+-dependent transporter